MKQSNINLILLCILLVVISGLVMGTIGYKVAKKSMYFDISDKFQEQAKNTAKNIVTAQAKITYELIQKSLDDNNEILPDSEKEDILNRLSKHTVGETGYIWVLDYGGEYVLSKDRLRDGEDIWEVQDSDGNMVIQDLVRVGKKVSGTGIAYYSYPWLNLGETKPREKIVAMVHFPELEWVVGISTYYDDFYKSVEYKKIFEKGRWIEFPLEF